MERVERLCRQEKLLPEEGIVLCALSGGADSVCLLHVLHELGQCWGFTVAAAHFNHQIRPEADADEAFCARFCAENAISFYAGRCDVAADARRNHRTLEESGRILRYDFLRATAREIGAAAIATAHNAEDNAETLLLHLLRGSGLRGLGGIAVKNGIIIRPLLTTSRREIEAYLAAHHLPHVEDITNRDTYYTRNYIRHQVLPLLRERNPSAVETLCRTARSLRQDNNYLEAQAAALLTDLEVKEGEVSLPAAILSQSHPSLSMRAVQQLTQRLSPETVLSAAHREGILSLCRGDSPSAGIHLPDGLTALRRYDRLVLHRQETAMDTAPVTLPLPGEVRWCGWHIMAGKSTCPGGHTFNHGDSFYLRANGPLLIRSRATGDAITLPSRHRKSLKKLLVEERIPREERAFLPVLVSDGTLCALGGFGTDTAFLPQGGEECWHIRLKRQNDSAKSGENEELGMRNEE